jgi:hypothetical protein
MEVRVGEGWIMAATSADQQVGVGVGLRELSQVENCAPICNGGFVNFLGDAFLFNGCRPWCSQEGFADYWERWLVTG